MTAAALSLLPSYRAQNLLVEFSALKHVQLRGVYLSLTPQNLSLWTGTLFVRKGVYAPAILRFRISFPPDYPFAQPLITFTSDVFHPLVEPLTTSSYTPSLDHQDPGTDGDQRLPPGAFSLRYGFPISPARNSRNPHNEPLDQIYTSTTKATSVSGEEDSNAPSDNVLNIVDVLIHLRACFEDYKLLDSIPSDAAVDPSAWYAYQSYRGRSAKKAPVQSQMASPASQNTPTRAKHPSEWNWEGVWADRVKKAIQNSQTDQSLYGSGASKDEDIHFLDIDEDGKRQIRVAAGLP